MRAAAAKKQYIRACLLCSTPFDPAVLDNHRGLVEGKDGGRYEWANIIPACPTCHRRVHLGEVQVLGRYPSTSGVPYYHVRVGGVEKFLKEAPPGVQP